LMTTGGGAMTSTVAAPEIPSAVAEIVVLPSVPPVTSPLASTVAMEASAVVRVNVFPLRTLASAACAVAVNWTVSAETTSAGSGLTVTVVMLVRTVIDAEPAIPSDVAVIVAAPSDNPVTLPLLSTEATTASALT
jgi:hypothetical protein